MKDLDHEKKSQIYKTIRLFDNLFPLAGCLKKKKKKKCRLTNKIKTNLILFKSDRTRTW